MTMTLLFTSAAAGSDEVLSVEEAERTSLVEEVLGKGPPVTISAR